MATTQYKELYSDDPAWPREAAGLAKAKIPFVLNGFSIEFDSQFCEALKEKFHFEATLDNTTARVYFRPRPSA